MESISIDYLERILIPQEQTFILFLAKSRSLKKIRIETILDFFQKDLIPTYHLDPIEIIGNPKILNGIEIDSIFSILVYQNEKIVLYLQNPKIDFIGKLLSWKI